ncbi:MAG: hypothetical protein O3C21_05670 [Verrucomicrobia bacterium]|nr:hypothetical protein [Verrucomicrobiota bacterium]
MSTLEFPDRTSAQFPELPLPKTLIFSIFNKKHPILTDAFHRHYGKLSTHFATTVFKKMKYSGKSKHRRVVRLEKSVLSPWAMEERNEHP